VTGRMTRRSFLKASTTAGAAMAGEGHDVPSFPFEEATIAELQAAMTAGRLSSRRLTGAYLRRN
jgi:hypothetical protein